MSKIEEMIDNFLEDPSGMPFPVDITQSDVKRLLKDFASEVVKELDRVRWNRMAKDSVALSVKDAAEEIGIDLNGK